LKSICRNLAAVFTLLLVVSLASVLVVGQEPGSIPEANATSAQMAKAAAADKLDINTATKDQLQALPGSATPIHKRSSTDAPIAPSSTW